MAVKWTVRMARLPDIIMHRQQWRYTLLGLLHCDVVGSSDGYSVGEVVEFKRGLKLY